jgi:hypothetical protein
MDDEIKPLNLKRIEQKLHACELLKHELLLHAGYKSALTPPHGEYPGNKQRLEQIIRYIIKKFYPGYQPKSLEIVVTQASKKLYAGVTYNPGQKLPMPLKIPWNTFESPAQLIMATGHEIIHELQVQRDYSSVNLFRLDKVITNMWEVEAHSWEINADSFTWNIQGDQNKVKRCLTREEIAETSANQETYKEELHKAILEIVKGPRHEVYAPSLAKWLNTDVWAKAVWLKDPANATWQSW